ncbi:MAG: hypothetical protein WDN45_17340 [Caulobacteraceae bacterium]
MTGSARRLRIGVWLEWPEGDVSNAGALARRVAFLAVGGPGSRKPASLHLAAPTALAGVLRARLTEIAGPEGEDWVLHTAIDLRARDAALAAAAAAAAHAEAVEAAGEAVQAQTEASEAKAEVVVASADADALAAALATIAQAASGSLRRDPRRGGGHRSQIETLSQPIPRGRSDLFKSKVLAQREAERLAALEQARAHEAARAPVREQERQIHAARVHEAEQRSEAAARRREGLAEAARLAAGQAERLTEAARLAAERAEGLADVATAAVRASDTYERTDEFAAGIDGLVQADGWLVMAPDYGAGAGLPGPRAIALARRHARRPAARLADADWAPGKPAALWREKAARMLAQGDPVIVASQDMAGGDAVRNLGLEPGRVRLAPPAPVDMQGQGGPDRARVRAELEGADNRYLRGFPFEDVRYIVAWSEGSPGLNLRVLTRAMRLLVQRDLMPIKVFVASPGGAPDQDAWREVLEQGLHHDLLPMPVLVDPRAGRSDPGRRAGALHRALGRRGGSVIGWSQAISLGVPGLVCDGPDVPRGPGPPPASRTRCSTPLTRKPWPGASRPPWPIATPWPSGRFARARRWSAPGRPCWMTIWRLWGWARPERPRRERETRSLLPARLPARSVRQREALRAGGDGQHPGSVRRARSWNGSTRRSPMSWACPTCCR